MAIDQVDQTVVTREPGPVGTDTTRTAIRRTTTGTPAGPELTRRIVVLLFGLIQVVIGARIVLLLLDAREANGLVSAIVGVSQVFVAPFEGVATDSVNAAGSILDVSAVVAFIGWTVIELIVLWAVGIFRREPA